MRSSTKRESSTKLLTSFTQAQVESPDAPEIHYNIGNVHYRKEEMDKSVEEYRASLRGEEASSSPPITTSATCTTRSRTSDAPFNPISRRSRSIPDDIEARQNLELALKQSQDSGGGESGEGEDDEEQKKDRASDEQQKEDQDKDQQQQPQTDQSQQDPSGMSKEEAERLLAALAEMEKTEQRRQQQKKYIRVKGKGKDW